VLGGRRHYHGPASNLHSHSDDTLNEMKGETNSSEVAA